MHDSDLIAFPTSHGAALPFEAHADHAERVAKHPHETKPLTLGGCIAGVCAACGPDRAEGILRFAVNSGIVVFPGQIQVEIAPRDARMDGVPNQHQATGLIRYFMQDGCDRRAVAPQPRRVRTPPVAVCFAESTPRGSGVAPTEWMQRRNFGTG